MSDMLARLYELARNLPEPPPVVRFEVGQAVLDGLKTAAPPNGTAPIEALFSVPVVLDENIDPAAWRAIGRDGEILKEGRLAPATGGHLLGELTFTRDDSVSCELPPQTRRFLVARWPDGLTKVREVFMGEADQ